MAINWAVLAVSCGEIEFTHHARLALAYLKQHHRVAARDAIIRGGVAGSYPTWGGYERFCYPAWAVKFFADAVMSVGRIAT